MYKSLIKHKVGFLQSKAQQSELCIVFHKLNVGCLGSSHQLWLCEGLACLPLRHCHNWECAWIWAAMKWGLHSLQLRLVRGCLCPLSSGAEVQPEENIPGLPLACHSLSHRSEYFHDMTCELSSHFNPNEFQSLITRHLLSLLMLLLFLQGANLLACGKMMQSITSKVCRNMRFLQKHNHRQLKNQQPGNRRSCELCCHWG